MAVVGNAGSHIDFNHQDLNKDMEDLSIKHPLQNSWTLWFYENDKAKKWEENLRQVSSFDTVEDFWSLYNHIKPTSDLKLGCDYSLFKKGIRPMWEDKANLNGGRWLINIDRRGTNNDEIDCMWLEILLCLVGEGFDEYTDEVCGAVVNVRPKFYKIALWTSDYRQREKILDIGHKLKSRLHILQRTSMTYQTHEVAARNSGPNGPVMLTL